ncbi:MAG: WGR domain-containing protein [Myxococcales bacterium]|nr:WGR domain-containing protein [Myxococcales bacterium]
MRRFELIDGDRRLYWQVEIDGEVVTTAYGKIGAKGRTIRAGHVNAQRAASAAARAIKRRLAKGYVEVGAEQPDVRAGASTKSEGAAAKPGAARLDAPILAGLIAGLERLAAHDDVLMETLIVRPPSGASTEGLPEDWRAFYGACDGLQVRWRHRCSRRDQDALNGQPFARLRKRKQARPIHELGYEVAGRVEIAPLAEIVGKNRAWEQVVRDVEEYCPADATLWIDPEEVPLVEAYALLRPFDRFDADAVVCVRRDTYRLLYTYQNKDLDFGAEREMRLAEYLGLLAAHGGAVDQRRANFAGERDLRIDLDDPETLLLDDYAPDMAKLLADFDPAAVWRTLTDGELDMDTLSQRAEQLDVILGALDGDRVAAFFEHALSELEAVAPGTEHPFEDALLTALRFIELNTVGVSPAQDEALRAHLLRLAAGGPLDFSRYLNLSCIFKERGDDERVAALIRARLAFDPSCSSAREDAKGAGLSL